jgi:uncharacterized protein (DUF305 family)
MDKTYVSYVKLGIALLVSYLLMWVLSMSMIRELDHFYWNLSNAWMALIMVAPMGFVMVVMMWQMFEHKVLNIVLLIGFAALFVLALIAGREEVLVGDEQFLDSMIPHHSRAILVCQESALTDPEIIELCASIVESQGEEIAQMKNILQDRY